MGWRCRNQRRLWRCVQQTLPGNLLGSQHLPPSFLMPALPFGTAAPLERYSAELQVGLWDIVLELVSCKEVSQLLDVALVQPVHLLLGGIVVNSLHFDRLPHCKTELSSGPEQREMSKYLKRSC